MLCRDHLSTATGAGKTKPTSASHCRPCLSAPGKTCSSICCEPFPHAAAGCIERLPTSHLVCVRQRALHLQPSTHLGFVVNDFRQAEDVVQASPGDVVRPAKPRRPCGLTGLVAWHRPTPPVPALRKRTLRTVPPVEAERAKVPSAHPSSAVPRLDRFADRWRDSTGLVRPAASRPVGHRPLGCYAQGAGASPVSSRWAT
jgi:hypothetical protein